jgi:ketosteroid isomerase-like protein
MRRLIFVVLLLVISEPAFAQEQATYEALPSIQLPAPLDRVLRDYETAWANGDEAALAALFTDDGFVPTPLGWVRGRAGITRVYENSSGSLVLRAIAFSVSDSVGYIIGAYNYGAVVGATDVGKFVLALRKDATGKWLIAADLDNSNRR